MSQEISTIEERLEALFHELVSLLPSGSVGLRVKRAPEISHDGVSIWLTPADPHAGMIVADAKNGDSTITLCVGRHTPIEVLPAGNRTTIDTVREICHAVIDGQFAEDLWLVGSEVTKCVGTLEYGDRCHVFRYWGRVFPLRKKERVHIQYGPYARK